MQLAKKSQSMPCIQRAEIVLDPEAAEEISQTSSVI
jgi:hypothetical protein